MAIFSMQGYFKSLKNSFTQSELATSVDFDLGELEGRILPMFERSSDTEIDSATDRLVYSQFKSQFKHSGNKVMFDILMDTIQQVIDNHEDITKLVKNEFNKENPKEITDYYKLNILKYFESIHFLSNYAGQWLNVVIVESLAEHAYLNLPDIKISKVFVTNYDNIAQLASICNMLDQPLDDFLKEISSLKGHQYAEYDWETRPEETQKKVDVFKSGLIPVRWNPLYHLGIMIATWQAEQDAKNTEQYKRLQFLLLQLKDKRDNTVDAASKERIDKQIEYHSNRLNLSQIKIEKLEERYG